MGAGKKVFIVLFRGVGGATQLPTAALRKALMEEGFENVSTYINSGNAVLASARTAKGTHAEIARIAKEQFGFDKDIMLVERKDWQRLVKDNPFPEAVEKPTTLHAFVLRRAPDKGEVLQLEQRAAPHERIVVKDNFLYFHAPEGFGTSKLPPVVDRILKTVSTARNWRTVLALKALAEDGV